MRTFALALLGPLLAASAAAAEWPLTLSARSVWAENLSRTSDTLRAKDAAVHEVSAATGWQRQLTAGWHLGAEATLGGETVPKFDALDTARAGLSAELRHKFGLGALAPVLHLAATTAQAEVNERGRSGTQLQGSVRLSKRLGSAWRVAAGAEWTRYYARHAPFDVRHRQVFAEAAWDVTSRWQLSAGATRLQGQLTANAAGPVYAAALAGAFGPAIQGYYNAIPWHVTNTYGPGWVAYRVDADADLWWAALAPALGERTSLPLRYERAEVVNRVGVRYVSEFWSLGIVHRF